MYNGPTYKTDDHLKVIAKRAQRNMETNKQNEWQGNRWQSNRKSKESGADEECAAADRSQEKSVELAPRLQQTGKNHVQSDDNRHKGGQVVVTKQDYKAKNINFTHICNMDDDHRMGQTRLKPTSITCDVGTEMTRRNPDSETTSP